MSLLQGIVMLLAFLIAVWVIFRGTSPIIVLLALAIAWTVLAGAGFRDLLANGLQKGREPYFTFYVIGFVVYLLMAFAMSAWHLRGVQVRRASAVATTMVTPRRVRVPWVSYLAPLVPVFVIIAFKWPLIPAFLLAIAFALVTTQGQRTVRATVDLFHKTFYDAFPDIATIAALWIICGMLIVAGQLEQVKAVLNPVFAPIIPHTPFQATVFFALLAPLAIYRGPFSIIGTGAALLAVMLNAAYVPPVFLYLPWRGPLCLQGSQDPTNPLPLVANRYTTVSHGDFLEA